MLLKLANSIWRPSWSSDTHIHRNSSDSADYHYERESIQIEWKETAGCACKFWNGGERGVERGGCHIEREIWSSVHQPGAVFKTSAMERNATVWSVSEELTCSLLCGWRSSLCEVVVSRPWHIALPPDLSIIEHNSKTLGHNDSNKCNYKVMVQKCN